MFERARLLQESNRDLLEAIRLYREVVSRAKDDRTLAARAQFEQGVIFERLGRKEEARNAFRSAITEFSDQTDIVRQAESRLGGQLRPPKMAVKQVWTGEEVNPGLSICADGRLAAYTERSGNIALHDLVTGEDRLVTHNPENIVGEGYDFVFSPDCKQIAYIWYRSLNEGLEVRTVGSDGSPPRSLWRAPPNELIALSDWSPDGSAIVGFIVDGKRILLFPTAGGPPKELPVSGKTWSVLFSPDGRYLAYDCLGESSSGDVCIQPASGGPVRELVRHPAEDMPVGWDLTGRNFLFISDRTGSNGLWIAPYADGKLQGEPRLIRDALGNIIPRRVTRKGTFYFLLGTGLQDVFTAEIDVARATVISGPRPVARRFVGVNSSPSWSPDGKFLTYVAKRGTSAKAVVFHDLGSGSEREVFPDVINLGHPRWAPDGGSLTFVGTTADFGGVLRMSPMSGAVTLVVGDPPVGSWLNYVTTWSPDGRVYYYRNNIRGVLRFDLDRREKTLIYEVPDGFTVAPNCPVVSPDGRFLAFNLWEKPTDHHSMGVKPLLRMLLILPLEGGPVRKLLTLEHPDSFAFGGAYAWTPDSRYLLVAHGELPAPAFPGGFPSSVWRVALDGSPPVKIGLDSSYLKYLAVHPDGRRIAFQAGEIDWQLWSLVSFLPEVSAVK